MAIPGMIATGCLLVSLLLPHVQGEEPSARAPLDEPKGRVLFTRQVNGRDDLFALDLTDGSLTQLTDHRAKDSHGVPSPDGEHVLFNSERVGWWKVWLMNSDGSEVRKLTAPRSGADYYPTWAPDGRRALYVSGARGNGDIVLLSSLDPGAEEVNLTRHPARDNFPAWSPDGDRIAFASDREGSWSLFVMAPDGSNTRRVTSAGEALEPAWFPDSRRLAYQATTETGGGRFQLFTVALGGEAKAAPVPLCPSEASDERPAVSPDGEWIVFESDRHGGSQLFLVPSGGGEVRALTHQGYCYGAAWFPGT